MISATWEMVEKIRDKRDEVLAKLDLIEAHFKIAQRSLVEAGERLAAFERAAREVLAAIDQHGDDAIPAGPIAELRDLIEPEPIAALEKAAREVLAAIKHFDNPSDGGLSQHHPLVEKLSNLLEPVVQAPDVVDSLAHQPERCDCPKENCTCPCNRCAFGPY